MYIFEEPSHEENLARIQGLHGCDVPAFTQTLIVMCNDPDTLFARGDEDLNKVSSVNASKELRKVTIHYT